IFTAPEIATVGFSEQDIENGAVEGVAYKLPLAANPRAKMMGIKDGFVKVIARKGSGTAIGAVIVAPKASELIYPLAIAIERRLNVDQASRVLAAYPSLSTSITDATRATHLVDMGWRPGRASADREQLVPGGHGGARCGVGRADHAVLVRLQRLLHLHRL